MRTIQQDIRTSRHTQLSAPLQRCVIAQLIAIGAAFPAHANALNAEPTNNAGTVQVTPGSRQPARQLQEIVVTAEKRKELLQNVPSTVSVLSTEQLEEQGAVQLSDYAKMVPAMNIIGARGPGLGEIVLRGITTGSDQSSPVAIYLNDVPFTPSSPLVLTYNLSFDPDLADIARIEVLEGPQSTLWGASAEGGVVRFDTKQPDLTSVRGDYSITGSDVDTGGTGAAFRGSVNLPLVANHVALLASASYRNDPGFVDNDFNASKNLNWTSTRGGSLLLRVQANDDLETTVMGLAQNIDQPGPNLVYLNPTTLRPAAGVLSYNSAVAQPSTSTYRTIADTTVYKTPMAQLTNVISYVKFSNVATTDWSELSALAGLPSGALINNANTSVSNRFTDELRLASNPGRVEYLLGLFYTNESDNNIEVLHGLTPDGTVFPSTSPYYNVYFGVFVPHFREEAAYGDLTYHLTHKISLTGGARYSANTQSVHWNTTGALGTNNVPTYNANDHALTYLVTLKYLLTSRLTAYARAASAYRPGGQNILNSLEISAGAPTAYKSDKLWNYEVGIKGAAWNRRITYTADAYHMVWSDLQLTETIRGFVVVANGSGAKSDGAEASVQLEPADGFTIGLRAAYTDARFTALAPALGAVSGDPLPYAPKTSMAAIVDYYFATDNDVTPTLGLTYAHHGANDSRYSDGTTYGIPKYETLDFRAGIAWSKYGATFRIKNVTDEYGLTSVTTGTQSRNPLVGTAIQPRTFELSLYARF